MARAPLFLERRSYRHRRLMDAVRLLPFVGLALWMLPLVWSGAPPQGGAEGPQGEPMQSSTALIFLFGVWFALILAGFVLTRKTLGTAPTTAPQGPASAPDPAARDTP